jgi:NAD(P)-dependent dehydrogenase (short-subunit alcohol dehydrogenase family)
MQTISADSAVRTVSAAVTEDRVALVSGGNCGLGLQIVRGLAEQRMRVVLGSRSARSGQDAIDLLGPLADRVAVRQLDVTDPASIARLAAWLELRLGRCDVLINNTAILFDDDHDTTMDLDAVCHGLEANLLGAWRLTAAIAPLMRGRGYGRVVNVSSGLGGAGRLANGGVNALTVMLADELSEQGIQVKVCCGGRRRRSARSIVRLATR